MKFHFCVVRLLEQAFDSETNKILSQIKQNLLIVLFQIEDLDKVTRTESL